MITEPANLLATQQRQDCKQTFRNNQLGLRANAHVESRRRVQTETEQSTRGEKMRVRECGLPQHLTRPRQREASIAVAHRVVGHRQQLTRQVESSASSEDNLQRWVQNNKTSAQRQVHECASGDVQCGWAIRRIRLDKAKLSCIRRHTTRENSVPQEGGCRQGPCIDCQVAAGKGMNNEHNNAGHTTTSCEPGWKLKAFGPKVCVPMLAIEVLQTSHARTHK